jgi:hypothetical protein
MPTGTSMRKWCLSIFTSSLHRFQHCYRSCSTVYLRWQEEPKKGMRLKCEVVTRMRLFSDLQYKVPGPSFYDDGLVVRIYTTKIYRSGWQVTLKKYFWSEVGAHPLTNQNELCRFCWNKYRVCLFVFFSVVGVWRGEWFNLLVVLIRRACVAVSR